MERLHGSGAADPRRAEDGALRRLEQHGGLLALGTASARVNGSPVQCPTDRIERTTARDGADFRIVIG